MLDSLFVLAQGIAETYGLWGVLFLAFAQELFPPLPSTVITFSAGILFLSGEVISWGTLYTLFLFVGLPIAVGLSVGAFIMYGIVYWGGKPMVEHWGRFVGVSWTDIERLQKYMKGHVWDDVMLFVARATPIIPSIALNVFCGLVRWRPLSFFLHTFFGTVIRAMWVGFLGWQVGSLYQKYADVFEGIQTSVFVLVLIGLIVFIVYRRRSRKGKEK